MNYESGEMKSDDSETFDFMQLAYPATIDEWFDANYEASWHKWQKDFSLDIIKKQSKNPICYIVIFAIIICIALVNYLLLPIFSIIIAFWKILNGTIFLVIAILGFVGFGASISRPLREIGHREIRHCEWNYDHMVNENDPPWLQSCFFPNAYAAIAEGPKKDALTFNRNSYLCEREVYEPSNIIIWSRLQDSAINFLKSFVLNAESFGEKPVENSLLVKWSFNPPKIYDKNEELTLVIENIKEYEKQASTELFKRIKKRIENIPGSNADKTEVLEKMNDFAYIKKEMMLERLDDGKLCLVLQKWTEESR